MVTASPEKEEKPPRRQGTVSNCRLPFLAPSASRRLNPLSRSGSRGVTLVETLIVVAIIALLASVAFFGLSAITKSRLRRSGTMIASAVRIAYAHANATSNVVRLEFDLDERTVSLEESSQPFLVKKNDQTGGAAAATALEKSAIEASDQILKGPVVPRAMFRPTKSFGFDPDKGRKGKDLGQGVRFLQIETGHDDLPVNSHRAYLYFWPGGQTERAAIQLTDGTGTDSSD